MDPFTDNFIDYDCQYDMKNEGLFEPEFTMSPPFSENSDINGVFGGFFNKTIKNILDPEEEAPRKESFASDANQLNGGKRPFQIVKRKKNDSTDSSDNSDSVDGSDGLYMPEERETKINTRSKRIQKKEKGRDKVKTPKPDPLEALIQKVDSKYLPEGFDDPNLDEKAKKRMIQMIRNRVSAQTSRDRKKAYLNQVEQVREGLSDENLRLVRENTKLLERVKKLEEENEDLKRSAGSLCSKCGCTLEYESQNNGETTDSTASNPSSPSYERAPTGGRRNFFGFGMAFAALACVLMVINGGSIGSFYQGQGKSVRNVKTNFMGRMMEQQQCQRTDKIFQPENILKNLDKELAKAGLNLGLGLGEFPPIIMEKINHLMEQFSTNSNQIYKAYENHREMIDLANRILPTDAQNNTGNSTFLRRTPTKEIKNRTSTLFCPTGFELFKHDAQIEIEQEMNKQISDLPRNKALNLETAEYIQLIIPKSSISQYRVPEVNNGTLESPILQNDVNDDDGSFYEVWVKPFAFREINSDKLGGLQNLLEESLF